MKPLYIINKKNNWHCQKQKTSRIFLGSDFVIHDDNCAEV